MSEATVGVWRRPTKEKHQLLRRVDELFRRCRGLDECLEAGVELLIGSISDGCVIDVVDDQGRLVVATAVDHIDEQIEATLDQGLGQRRQLIGPPQIRHRLHRENCWLWEPALDAPTEAMSEPFEGAGGDSLGESLSSTLGEATSQTGAWDDGPSGRLFFEMIDELEPHSVLLAPLVGPTGLVGVLTLMMTRPLSPRYDEQALAFIDELAARMAPVVDGFRTRRLRRSHNRTEEIDHQLAMNKAVTQHLGEGTVAVDVDGSVTFANPAASRLLGYESPTDLMGKYFHDLVHGPGECKDGNRCALLLGEASGADIQSQDDAFLKRGGGRLPVAYTRTRLATDEHSGHGAVIVFRDMSNYHDMQAQLLSTDRMVAVGTLAAGIAHEINNPLAFVQSNVRFVLRAFEARRGDGGASSFDDHTLHEALLDGMEGIERIRAIVAGMQAFTGGEQEHGCVDVEKCLEDALTVCYGRIKGCADIVRRGGELQSTPGNAAQITQIFVNLLLNAAMAIEESGTYGEIEVSTAVEEDRQSVEIVDDGIGLDGELRKQIFDPFFTTREVGGGTGLGLYICRAIVRELRGEIEVNSEPGEGAAFRVILPRSDHGKGLE